jgi:geranylgeranyl diphosphate synthase type II
MTAINHAAAKKINSYLHLIEHGLAHAMPRPYPSTLYDPARYILAGGGKRIRPLLAMLAAEAVGGKATDALQAGLALEVLHNFTLVHDDIMDHADIRRGRPTVHKKWDASVAILSGDVMIGIAYELILKTKTNQFHKLLGVFTEGVVTVCEGQAYDKEFETRKKVSLEDYLMMISKKTGRLISIALEMGGLAADASPRLVKALRDYGTLIGEAFQVQDDMLDIIADEKAFGKTIGGDLVQGKKTFLLLRAIELTSGKEKKLLQSIIDNKGIDKSQVLTVKDIYERCGAIAEADIRVKRNFKKAEAIIRRLPDNKGRESLILFAEGIMNRSF